MCWRQPWRWAWSNGCDHLILIAGFARPGPNRALPYIQPASAPAATAAFLLAKEPAGASSPCSFSLHVISAFSLVFNCGSKTIPPAPSSGITKGCPYESMRHPPMPSFCILHLRPCESLPSGCLEAPFYSFPSETGFRTSSSGSSCRFRNLLTYSKPLQVFLFCVSSPVSSPNLRFFLQNRFSSTTGSSQKQPLLPTARSSFS